MKKRITLLTLMAILFSGCALLGKRADFDDLTEGPVTGGLMADASQLGNTSDFSSVYEDRGPASGSRLNALGQQGGSWLSSDDMDKARTDAYRYAPKNQEGDPMVLSSDQMANLDPKVKRNYKNGVRATKQDFVDDAPNEGSLWGSDGQTNYYFTKNKIRGVGDIVTLNMEEPLIRDVGLEIRRNLSPREKETELMLAQERLTKEAKGEAEKSATASGGAAAKKKGEEEEKKETEVQVREATLSDIDVSKSLELKAGEPMMGEIIERFPNGNYKVRASKRVPYKNGSSRVVNLMGIAKGSDISDEDIIQSGKLYEYRVEALR